MKSIPDLQYLWKQTTEKCPSKVSKHADEKQLGRWLNQQKTKYKNYIQKMADPERRKKWEQLLDQFPILNESLDDKWDSTFNDLVRFLEANNGRKCPSSSSKNYDEKRLGIWLGRQKKYSQDITEKMYDSERRKKWFQLLERFPILNESTDDKWDSNCIELVDFLVVYNGTKYPSQYSNDQNEKKLGVWLCTQKRNYMNEAHGMKNPERRLKWGKIVERFPILKNTTSDVSLCSSDATATILDPTEMTEEEKNKIILKFLKQQESQKRGYNAPNPDAKNQINSNLKANLPKTGKILVLDHTDFKSATSLNFPKRTIIPQRDADVYKQMKQDSNFGKCVVHSELLDFLRHNKNKYGLVYADLMGSIKEAIPILDELKGRIQKNGVVAVTISCRDGEESSYTNEFSARLLVEMCKRFPNNTILTPRDVPIVYGECVRMATLIMKIL